MQSARRLDVHDRRAIVDRHGELKRRMLEFQPLRDEYVRLAHEIQSWYDDAPAAQSFIAEGDKYNCQVSARDRISEIKSMKAVYRHFKLQGFLALVRVPLGVLRKALPDELHSEFLNTAQTGRRRLKPVARPIPIRRTPKSVA